jgi:hypothetical protein
MLQQNNNTRKQMVHAAENLRGVGRYFFGILSGMLFSKL